MSCYCPTKTPSRYCYTNEQDGRIAYRLYCPECKGFVGSKVKKEVALACGYELKVQSGSTIDYQCRTISKELIGIGSDTYRLRIGVKKIFTHTNYLIYDPDTREELRHIPDFYIQWARFSTDDWLRFLIDNIVDLTPISPIHRPKIPKDLLQNYKDYLESPQWQRKRSERLAIDRKQCVLCGELNNLHVHHVTYERLFHEKMSDLMTVCKSCHEVLHDREFNN